VAVALYGSVVRARVKIGTLNETGAGRRDEGPEDSRSGVRSHAVRERSISVADIAVRLLVLS